MAVNYKVIGCTNPKGSEGIDYACNRAVKSGDYTFKELADDIQFATTVTKPDVVAVLTATKEYLKKHLLQGQRIVLDELGSLQVNLSSKCFPQSVIQTDSFDAYTYIRKVGIRFRPEADLLKYVRSNRALHRVPSDLLG